MDTIKRAVAAVLAGLRWLFLALASWLTVAGETLQDVADRLRP